VHVTEYGNLHRTLPAPIAQTVKEPKSPGSKEQQCRNANDQ
jgi:hypothetical protein